MLRKLEIPKKKGSFLRTLAGNPIIVEFQESEGNCMAVEIPGILERRYVTGHEGHYIKDTDIQVIAGELEGIFYSRTNGRKTVGIVLSPKTQRMLKYKNGRLSL